MINALNRILNRLACIVGAVGLMAAMAYVDTLAAEVMHPADVFSVLMLVLYNIISVLAILHLGRILLGVRSTLSDLGRTVWSIDTWGDKYVVSHRELLFWHKCLDENDELLVFDTVNEAGEFISRQLDDGKGKESSDPDEIGL